MILSFRHNKVMVVGFLIGVFILSAAFAYGQKPSIGLITGILEDRADWGTTALNTMEVKHTIIEKGDYKQNILSTFDVIAIGVVAYDTNEDLKKNLKEILRYVENGGYVFLLDYQQDSTWQPEFTPYPLTLTDSDIKDDPPDVSLADHPIWNTPNKITPDDFANWSQGGQGAEEFAADGPEDADTSNWTVLLSAGPQMWATVLLAEYGRGVYVFSALELSQVVVEEKKGKEGAMRIIQNFIAYYEALSVSAKGKIAFTWGKIKGNYN